MILVNMLQILSFLVLTLLKVRFFIKSLQIHYSQTGHSLQIRGFFPGGIVFISLSLYINFFLIDLLKD